MDSAETETFSNTVALYHGWLLSLGVSLIKRFPNFVICLKALKDTYFLTLWEYKIKVSILNNVLQEKQYPIEKVSLIQPSSAGSLGNNRQTFNVFTMVFELIPNYQQQKKKTKSRITTKRYPERNLNLKIHNDEALSFLAGGGHLSVKI